jgi:Na+/melibiose symporter-like transporter
LSVPLVVLSLPIVIYVGPFYGKELGLGLAHVGVIFLVVRTLDAILDVFVGRWSDRTTFAWGRRKTWVAIGVPLLMLGTWLVSFPPASPSGFYFGVAVSIFYIGWTALGTLIVGFVTVIAFVPDPPQQTQPDAAPVNFIDLLRDWELMLALVALLLMTVATGCYNGVILLLIEEEFGVKGWFLPMIFGQYLVCLATVPLTVAATRRYGLVSTLAAGLIVFILGLTFAGLFPIIKVAPVVVAASAGIFVSTQFILSTALVSEYAARRSKAEGRDRMGEHQALSNLAAKLGAAIGASVGLIAFDWLRQSGLGQGIPMLSTGRVVALSLPLLFIATRTLPGQQRDTKIPDTAILPS